VVPSNTTGLSARRLLAVGDSRTGLPSINLANVSFVTPFRLAEMLGAGLVGVRKPLTNPVLASAIRATLATNPGMFAAVAGHQATQSAIVALYGELSRALPVTRERIASASRRGAEVVRVVGEVAARLCEFFDEDDLAEAATAHLDAAPEAAHQLGTFVWYLPDRLTPAMTSLMAAALARTRSAGVVVALTAEPTADAAVVDTVRRVGIALEDKDASIAGIQRPSADRMLSVSDGDEEVRQVVREILQLASEGMPLDRMAVFLPASASYGRTLIQQLDGAGIPHNGAAPKRLAETVAGRTLLTALALDNNGWGRSDVIALVADAPVRAGHRLVPSRRWDTISRRAGVVGGLGNWQVKLHQLEATFEATIAEVDQHESEKSARRYAMALDLETTRQLAAFVDRLAGGLAALDQSRAWAERAEATQVLLDELLGHEQGRSHWPEFEVAAAQRVDEAIAGLAMLDGIEANPTRATFQLAVAAELDATVGRIGRFGHGVLVAPLSSAAGHDLDAVFILGMAEGTCPSIRREEALLPDIDRHLADRGELQTQDDRLGAQHRSYLAALAAAGHRRTLLFPRGDLRGRRDRLASRWLLDSASELAGRRLFSSDVAHLPDEVMHTVASYVEGVAHAGIHGSVVERDVAALLASGDRAHHPLAVGDLGRGFTARSARTGPQFTVWDGNLAGQAGAISSPATGAAMSPSRLEMWASCPFKYFLANVLGLREREDPERIVELSPAERGTLIHAVLEAFITEVLERSEGPPGPDERWTSDDRQRVTELAEEAFVVVEDKGLTGRPRTWRRTKTEVLIDLDVFLTKDDEHRRQNRLRPALAEMAFGMNGEAPLSMELPNGRTLTFRGKADRVDIADDGHLVVLDYKTGSGWGYDKLADDPVRAGTTLQLGLYAEAALTRLGADEAEASYWMISSRGKYKKHGYPWTEATRKRFLDVTEAIVDGIESGLFPALPGEYNSFFAKHDNCTYCDFDRICPRDREDHQRATAGAPELTLLQRLELKEEQA
jgi:RecB family exonuclease